MTQLLSPIGSSAGSAPDTSRLASKDNLEAAGQRFEAIFVGMMLKSMRAAKLGDGLFDSKAREQFRDMQDQQLAQSMAANTPLGIGKAMTAFLARANAAAEASNVAVSTPADAPTAPKAGDAA